MDETVPLWLTLVIALGGAVIGFLSNAVTGWIDWRKTTSTNELARSAAQEAAALEQSKNDLARSAAEETATLERSRGNRELIQTAIGLRDGTPGGDQMSLDLLESIVTMKKLSEDDALFVTTFITRLRDTALDRARTVELETGESSHFVLEDPDDDDTEVVK